ncbi:MAG: TIGR03668 family PPOX class F420-dependent oxidoreductase [Candidatus Dormibacteraceae bacterium]
MTLEEARRRVGLARIARLATLRPDGSPHLVPFCFALQGDRLVSAVDQKPKRTELLQRLANVRRDPRAAVLVDEYDERWEQLWWVRLDGVAAILPPGVDSEAARALLAAKYEQYRARPPLGEVLSLTIRRWSSWEARPG